MTEITKLIKKYEQQVPVKDLAKQFGIHRLTVTALLRRHGVELRRSGLEPAEVRQPPACVSKAGHWSGWERGSVLIRRRCGGRCELLAS